jgi:NADH-quinone oxidoreductase subunit J
MPVSFYIVGFITIVSAICAVSLRNLIHCALCLALSFVGVAGLFLQMQASFIAFAQILVYVGAVAILIVFAILLTRSSEREEKRAGSSLLLNVPLAAGVGLILLNCIHSTVLTDGREPALPPTVHELGIRLMTSHVIPLEAIGVLLTIALLGAVVLSLNEPATKGIETP